MGPLPSEPERMQESSQGKDQNMSYAVSSVQGWRRFMEDTYITLSPFTSHKGRKNHLFAVFDGHGGAQIATYVSRHFAGELQSNMHYQTQQYEIALRQTFYKMDELIILPDTKSQLLAIRKQMQLKGNCSPYDDISDFSQIGSTANVILLTPQKVYCANAGDSRSVAMVNGTVVELSKDHRPQDPIELQRITKAGGTVTWGRVNGGLNLSRCLGDWSYKQANLPLNEQMITANPDIMEIEVKDLEFIIMGCDGIWQTKKNSQMVNQISNKISKKIKNIKIVQQMLDGMIARDTSTSMGCDNMTAILISFE